MSQNDDFLRHHLLLRIEYDTPRFDDPLKLSVREREGRR